MATIPQNVETEPGKFATKSGYRRAPAPSCVQPSSLNWIDWNDAMIGPVTSAISAW